MYSTALSSGMMPVMWKKAACKIVLVRLPKPNSAAMATESMTYRLMCFFAIARRIETGRWASSAATSAQSQASRKLPPSFKSETMS